MSERSVNELEIIRYYLKCEIGKIVTEWIQTEDFIKSFDRAIDNLDADEAIRLARTLSCGYRHNPICEKWGLLAWRLQNTPCQELLVSRINDKVNPTLERCGFNLGAFVRYLRNGGIEDENLTEFRDDGRRISHPTVIAEQSLGILQILDGSHRAVILALRGNSEMSCYIGHKS